jgi:hypothetical protein
MADSRTLLEQKEMTESPSKKQKKVVIDHNPTDAFEMMPVRFPSGLPKIVLHYLDSDMLPVQQRNQPQQYTQFKLFARTLTDLIRDEAAVVGNLILRGEEKDVEDALAIIRKKPILIHCQTEATDPLGRRVKGTLLQIAAMAGDVDLKAGIRNEKVRGMAERLIAAGNLSQEEVAEQLQVITCHEAQLENEARIQHILSAVKKFGTSICEVKTNKNMQFGVFQTLCKPLIDQLETDLQTDTKGMITSGYIFDPKILQEATKWFVENVDKRFGGWWSIQSDVFWVNGFGKLQSKLSSRDAQVVNAGIGRVVDQGNLPSRTLNNASGASHFYNSTSHLGASFYLGYYGGTMFASDAARWRWTRCFWKTYVEQKQQHCKLMQCPDNRSQFESCLVM